MADFCKQCSIENFGEDYQDLAGLTSPEETAQGIRYHCICEGCGPLLVDHTGQRNDYLQD